MKKGRVILFQENEKLSEHQGLILVFTSSIGNTFLVVSHPAIEGAGRDGWISVLIAYLLSTAIGLMFINLASRFPNKTVVQYMPIVLGKSVGKLMGFIYIVTTLVMPACGLREGVELMKYFLPYTPPVVTSVAIFILIAYVLKKGFEVYARLAELFFIFVIIFIILLLVLTLPRTDWGNLMPMLDNNFMSVIKGLPIHLSYSLETILFMALWFPCLNSKAKTKANKMVLIAMPLSGLLMTAVVIVNIAFTGIALGKELVFPLYYMSEYIAIGDFITGVEGIFLFLWMIATFLVLPVLFLPSVVSLAQWFNLKDYRPLIVPMSLIVITLSFIPSNILETFAVDGFISTYFKLTIALFITLIVCPIAAVRGLEESNFEN